MPKPEPSARSRAEACIDAMNAELQATFLREFPVLDMARAEDAADDPRHALAAWVGAGRILALPLPGRMVCPAFQLDSAGQPWPLIAPALAALRPDFTPWQRAFWLVSGNEWLDGDIPINAIRNGDDAVLEAARMAGDLAVG